MRLNCCTMYIQYTRSYRDEGHTLSWVIFFFDRHATTHYTRTHTLLYSYVQYGIASSESFPCTLITIKEHSRKNVKLSSSFVRFVVIVIRAGGT